MSGDDHATRQRIAVSPAMQPHAQNALARFERRHPSCEAELYDKTLLIRATPAEAAQLERSWTQLLHGERLHSVGEQVRRAVSQALLAP